MLSSLPPELIMEIIDKVDLPGQLNLRQTNSEFNSMVLSSEQFWIKLTDHKEEQTKKIDQIKVLIEHDPNLIIPNSIPVEKKIQKFKMRYTRYPKHRRYPHCLSWQGLALSICIGILSGTIFSMGCCFDERGKSIFWMYLVISWIIGVIPFLGGYVLFTSLYASKSCFDSRLDKFRKKRDQKYEDLIKISRGSIFKL